MARSARISITGDARSLLTALRQSSAAVAAFQKQLAQAGLATSKTSFTPREMARMQKQYLKGIEDGNAKVARSSKIAGDAQASSAKKAAAATRAWVLHTKEGDKIIVDSEKHAKALARNGDAFYELTGGAKKFVQIGKDGTRILIDHENQAKELQRRLGTTYEPLNAGAEHARAQARALSNELESTSTHTAKGAASMRNFADQTRMVGDDMKRAKLPEHNLQLGRFTRGGLAGAGAFTSLGRSIAYASASFLAFAVLSGVFRSAVAAAAQFEESLTRIVGLAGGARDQVQKFGHELLRIAPAVGTGPRELADALYFVASSGIAAADQMGVVTVSAKASAAGLGETKVVADAVTSAMNAYGAANLTAAQATNVLVDTVRYGKGEAASFAPVIGTVASFAASLGVKFHEVGAALAAMTRLGIPAYTAAIELQAVFTNILHPTKQADASLQALAKRAGIAGLSFAGLTAQLKEHGLLSVFATLRKVFKDNGAAMAQVFTNVRALRGVLSILGKSASETFKIFQKMAGSSRALAIAFGAASKDPAFRFRALQATLESLEISIGSALLPSVLKVGDALGKWLNKPGNIEKLNKSIQEAMGLFTDLLQAVKAIAMPLASLAKIGASLSGGWGSFFKFMIAGFALMKIRSHFFTNDLSRSHKQAALASANEWIKSNLSVKQSMGSIGNVFSQKMNSFRADREKTSKAVAVNLPRGATSLPPNVFQPSPGRFMTQGAGGRVTDVRFVQQGGRIRSAIRSNFASINQTMMREQQRLSRTSPGIGGLINSLFGTATRQQDAMGRATTQLKRAGRTSISDVFRSLSQSSMQAQQGLSRSRPALGGLVNSLFGTATRQQDALGRATTQLKRVGRTTIGDVFRSLNQTMMREQQKLSRQSPGVGRIANALLGTATRQQDAFGRATTQLKREGRTSITEAFASLNQSVMKAQQKVSRKPGGGIVNSIFGTPTRSQNELGQFTSMLKRQGGVLDGLMARWRGLASSVRDFVTGTRNVGGVKVPIDPGPIRKSLQSIGASMSAAASAGKQSFLVAFSGMRVAAKATATTMWLTFRFALLNIGRLMATAFATVGWGLLIFAVTEFAFHIKDVAHWLSRGSNSAKEMNNSLNGLNDSMQQTVRLSKELSSRGGRVDTAEGARDIAAKNLASAQAALARASGDKGRAAATAQVAQMQDKLFAAEKRLQLVEQARNRTLEQLGLLERQRPALIESTTAKIEAQIQKQRDLLKSLKLSGNKELLRQGRETSVSGLVEDLTKSAEKAKPLQRTVDLALAGIMAATNQLASPKQLRIIVKLAVQGKTINDIVRQILGIGVSTEQTRLRGVASEADDRRRQSRIHIPKPQDLLPFTPGAVGSKFALPPDLLLRQAKAGAEGSKQKQVAVTKAMIEWIQTTLKSYKLTTDQQTDAFNTLGSLRQQIKQAAKQFEVKPGLQLNQAQANLSGSSKSIMSAEVAIRDWIIQVMNTGKHSKDWMIAAVNELKQVKDDIASAQTELPLNIQLQSAKATTKKQQITAARATRDYFQGLIDSGKLGTKGLIEAFTQKNAAQGQIDSLVEKEAKKQFEIPKRLLLQEAKASASGSEKQQKEVNRRVIAFIRGQINQGKLHGDALIAAYNELGSRIQKSVSNHKDLVKQATDQIASAMDDARSTIGDLFHGPLLDPTDVQKQTTLGLTQMTGDILSKDIAAQNKQTTKWLQAIDLLRKKGGPQTLIDELVKQGVAGMPNVEAILGLKGEDFKKFLKNFSAREKLALRIAMINLKSDKVNVVARNIALTLTNKQLKQFTETGTLPKAAGVAVTAPGGGRGSTAPSTVPSSIGSLVRAGGGVTPGSGNRDSVAAMLTPGEVVFNSKHQKKLASALGVSGAGPHTLFSFVKNLPGHVRGFKDGGVAGNTKFKDLPDREKMRRIVSGYSHGRMSWADSVAALKFWGLHLPQTRGDRGPRLEKEHRSRVRIRDIAPGFAAARDSLKITEEDRLRFYASQVHASKQQTRASLGWYRSHSQDRSFNRFIGWAGWASMFIPGGRFGAVRDAARAGAGAGVVDVPLSALRPGQQIMVKGKAQTIKSTHPVYRVTKTTSKLSGHQNEHRTPKALKVVTDKGSFDIPAGKRTARIRVQSPGRSAPIQGMRQRPLDPATQKYLAQLRNDPHMTRKAPAPPSVRGESKGIDTLVENLTGGRQVFWDGQWRTVKTKHPLKGGGGYMVVPETGKPFKIPTSQKFVRTRPVPIMPTGVEKTPRAHTRRVAPHIPRGGRSLAKTPRTRESIAAVRSEMEYLRSLYVQTEQQIQLLIGNRNLAKTGGAGRRTLSDEERAQALLRINSRIRQLKGQQSVIGLAYQHLRHTEMPGVKKGARARADVSGAGGRVGSGDMADLFMKNPPRFFRSPMRKVGAVKATIDDFDSRISSLRKIKELITDRNWQPPYAKAQRRPAGVLRDRVRKLQAGFVTNFEKMRDDDGSKEAARQVQKTISFWLGARNQAITNFSKLSESDMKLLQKMYHDSGQEFPKRVAGAALPQKPGGKNVSSPRRGQAGRKVSEIVKKAARPVMTKAWRTTGDGTNLFLGWEKLKVGEKVVSYGVPFEDKTGGGPRVLARGVFKGKGGSETNRYALVQWGDEAVTRVSSPARTLRRPDQLEPPTKAPKDTNVPRGQVQKVKEAAAQPQRLNSRNVEANKIQVGDQIMMVHGRPAHRAPTRAAIAKQKELRPEWRKVNSVKVQENGTLIAVHGSGKAFLEPSGQKFQVRRPQGSGPTERGFKYAWELKEGWQFRTQNGRKWLKILDKENRKDKQGRTSEVKIKTPDGGFILPAGQRLRTKFAMGGVVPAAYAGGGVVGAIKKALGGPKRAFDWFKSTEGRENRFYALQEQLVKSGVPRQKSSAWAWDMLNPKGEWQREQRRGQIHEQKRFSGGGAVSASDLAARPLLAKSMGVPMMAKGGIVRKPTSAIIGENGPEAVIPLSTLKQFGASVVNLSARTVNMTAMPSSGITPAHSGTPVEVNVYIEGIKQKTKVRTTVRQRRGGGKSSDVPGSIGSWI